MPTDRIVSIICAEMLALPLRRAVLALLGLRVLLEIDSLAMESFDGADSE